MKYINELTKSLEDFFGWNKARVECLAQIILSLLCVKTVNLTDLATGFKRKAKLESSYIRLKRFFREFEMDYDALAKFLFSLFVKKGEKCFIAIDRTNWNFGIKKINILMLALTYRGIAIPIYWKLLGKKGNSNTRERIEILNRFIASFGVEVIGGILADREFLGGSWFDYLLRNKIPFYIRIKKDTLTIDKFGRGKSLWQLFAGLPKGEAVFYEEPYKIYGKYWLKVAGMKLLDGGFLIVVTASDVANAIEYYKQRWEIETLFSCLKTRGFNLEETRITIAERLEKLVAVLAITFAWAYKIGIWSDKQLAPIVIKKHGYKQISLFRYGFNKLRNFLLRTMFAVKTFCKFVRFLFEPLEKLLTDDFKCVSGVQI